MPRRRRLCIPGLSHHVIQRGNNRMQIFHQTADYEFYLAILGRAAVAMGVDVNAFALMTTHTHLIATPHADGRLGRLMQRIGAHYARYFNRAYDRIGPVWNGRYSATPIDSEVYWLTCLRYVEQNPVRAGIVNRPEDYRWSSYCAHAYGNGPEWLTSHWVFETLGGTSRARQKAYRALCGALLSDEELALSRSAIASRAALALTPGSEQGSEQGSE